MISKRKYTSMQAIDRFSGLRYDYTPDISPSSYEDIANIVALFHVKEKFKTRWWRFKLFGKWYWLKLFSKW